PTAWSPARTSTRTRSRSSVRSASSGTDSERSREVLDDGAAAGVEPDPDHVEADRAVAGREVLGQPGAREAADLHLFASADGMGGLRGPAEAAGAHRLHLDEDERLAVDRDRIDLPEAGSRVAGDDHESVALEPPAGEVLTDPAGSQLCFRHRPAPRCRMSRG